MLDGYTVGVVIPALDEEEAIAAVVAAVPGYVDRIVVADNGSRDATAAAARAAGADVLREERRGYGAACQAALERLDDTDLIVFVDGDGSMDLREMDRVVAPLLEGRADLVVGSRVRGRAAPGSMPPVARWGTRLAAWWLRRSFGVDCTDLGPFRAIRRDALEMLELDDLNYGWTVQMQARAYAAGLRVEEVAVTSLVRRGESKISGTLRGVVGASVAILRHLVVATLGERRRSRRLRPASDRIVIFTRYPRAGRAKTRLIPRLGPAGAAALQRRMTRRLVEDLRARGAPSWEIELRYAGGTAELVRMAFGAGVRCVAQGPGGLGERMARALEEGFAAGARRVAILGTDCPELSAGEVRRLFGALDEGADCAIVPALDGGYVALAAARPLAPLFRGPRWGGETVLEETLALARAAEIDVRLLGPLADLDRPEDLDRALDDGRLPRSWTRATTIGVVIPALNEAAGIGRAVTSALAGGAEDVVVVDGGSRDRTVDAAIEAGARVVRTRRASRGHQLRRGIDEVRGEVVLMLHADARLPRGWADDLRAALLDPGVVGGAFELSIAGGGLGLRLVEAVARRRSRVRSLPYGDQGIFARREVLEAIGGVPDQPILEDVELVRRLGRRGRLVLVPRRISVSDRRWRRQGWLAVSLIHWLARRLDQLGVPPVQLDRWYRRWSGNPR